MTDSKDEKLLSELYNYVVSRWKSVTIVAIVVGALGLLYSFIAPHSYTATATILPPLQNSSGGGLSSMLASVGKSIPFGGFGGGSNSTEYYLDIIQSRTIADRIAKELDLYSHPRFEELDSIIVQFIIQSTLEADSEMSGMMQINSRVFTEYFPDSDDKEWAKELSAKIANSAAYQLNDYLIERENERAAETRQYIEAELDKYNSKLDTLSILFEEFQKENKLLSLDDQTQATISQASQLGSEIAVAKAELELAKITFAEGSQEVKNLKNKLTALEAQYKSSQTGGISSADQFSLPLGQIPNIARRYAILYRDREVLEQVILFLETQKHQEAIQETKEVSQIDILDTPIVPLDKSSPSRILLPVASAIVSSILFVFFLSIKAYRKGRKASIT